MKQFKTLLLLIVIGTLASCSTSYRIQNYTAKKVFSYRKGGVRYVIVDTYTREVKADTIKLK